jgi:hypothetical protein
MAVAAHVGRVSKDYAPYGYSIMEDVHIGTGVMASGGGLQMRFPLLADDADVMIESIKIAPMGSTGGVASDTVNWKIEFAAWRPADGLPDDGGGARNAATTTLLATARVTDVAGGALTAFTVEAQTLTSAPLVAKDSVLTLFVDPLLAPANLVLLVWVRYRRKA